ncbi:MAG: hypothetical protein H3Z53_05405 [archaeon]|nr:hypothetical protein [archaeon]
MKTEREKPIKTKKGIILYKGKGDNWYIEYPDGDKRYGGATTIRVMNLIYYLSKGKSIDEADRLAFGEG